MENYVNEVSLQLVLCDCFLGWFSLDFGIRKKARSEGRGFRRDSTKFKKKACDKFAGLPVPAETLGG